MSTPESSQLQHLQSILIIDDDPVTVKILATEFSHDCRVFTATSGEEGLATARRELPDMILLDILMPGINGFEVCEQINSWRDTGNIPVVIFVTSVRDDSDEARGLELGAIDYITKPLNMPVVRQRVRNHLKVKWHRDLLEEVMDELAHKNRQLEIFALQDGLTGLANRRCFDETFEIELRRARRTAAPLSLLMIDVDFFKLYNDRYGHLAGDDCLRVVGTLMMRLFRRAGDLPARYGGEEFAVILPETSSDKALTLAEAFRTKLANEGTRRADGALSEAVTVSIGIVSVDQVSDQTVEWFTSRADTALYRSKEQGRNRVTLIREQDSP
ncbi:MAG TPA: diguanylate cyclase [Desulfuromonadales bacterium]|nr:diguanylate cyclase [Desulfuromonadales bacterium]